MFSVELPSLNIWAILVAVALHTLIGALWYSPILFSNLWQKEKPEGKHKGTLTEGMSVTILGGLVAFTSLAIIVGYTGSASFLSGMKIGLLFWLGATYANVMNSAYQGGSRKLILIDNGYTLITFALAGGIFGSWI